MQEVGHPHYMSIIPLFDRYQEANVWEALEEARSHAGAQVHYPSVCTVSQGLRSTVLHLDRLPGIRYNEQPVADRKYDQQLLKGGRHKSMVGSPCSLCGFPFAMTEYPN